MVSVYPNPPHGQEFTHFNSYYLSGDPMNNTNKNNSNLLSWISGPGMEDPNKKVRKPYTITKSRESWSEQEHDKFLEALQLFDRDWKKIEAFVGTKTVIQIRSHAQKYFLKVQKNGTSEHVPPPRPKRKAAHPYPQKAPKIVVSQATAPLQPSATLVEPGYSMMHHDLVPAPINPTISSTLSSHWIYNVAPPVCMSHVPKDDLVSTGVAFTHNNSSSSSNESTPANAWTSNQANPQVKENHEKPTRVMPDFAQVYRFIGSVFDPNASDHLQWLKTMEPIDVETAVMLMKNLSVNLANPEFDNHRKLLSTYNVEKGMRSSIQAV